MQSALSFPDAAVMAQMISSRIFMCDIQSGIHLYVHK